MKRFVILESPFAGDVVRNKAYALACMRDSLLNHNEAPFMSHILYTEALDDMVPEERTIGIDAGLEIGTRAEATIVYIDLGISPGMKLGIEHAREHGRHIEYRNLVSWRDDK